MSWSESFGPCTLEELENLEPKNKVSQEQFTAAKAAVVELARSGCVGTDVRFVGALNGHENEDHKPLPGWTNDCVYISLSQAREPSAQDRAANEGS